MKEILGDEYANELEKFWRYNKPFKFAITIDCRSMVEDFHEDLEFRFSLGVESIARRLLSISRGQPITAIDSDVVSVANKNEVDTMVAKIFVQSATYLANGSLGIALAGLIVAYLSIMSDFLKNNFSKVYKHVDWRWIAGGVGFIGALYALERYRWNAGAKENRLKVVSSLESDSVGKNLTLGSISLASRTTNATSRTCAYQPMRSASGQ